VLVFVALALPVLAGMVGLGIDTSMLFLAHSRLQTAVDSAALAGSLQLPFDPELDQGLVVAAVNDLMARNFPEAEITDISQGGELRSVRVTARAEVDMLLLGVLGVTSKYVEASALAGFNNLEIVFVIDNSGSMKGTPISETNQAAENLVDLVMPDGGASSVKVGLVPFRGKVRIGTGVDAYPAGCRNADGSLNTGLLEQYEDQEYRYPSWYPLMVSSDTCSSIPETLGLSTDKGAVISAINSQDALGDFSGTVVSEGLKWGRHVLTPEAPFSEGSGEDDMRKIMIILTDGDTEDGMCGGAHGAYYTPNNYWTNAYYGMGVTDCHCGDGGCLDQAVLDEAQIAKDEGIEIFAIRFGQSDAVDIEIMKAVASSKPGTDDHYFDAPSAYDIDEIFKLIGRQLGWRLLH